MRLGPDRLEEYPIVRLPVAAFPLAPAGAQTLRSSFHSTARPVIEQALRLAVRRAKCLCAVADGPHFSPKAVIVDSEFRGRCRQVSMFTPDDRSRISACVLERARADHRVVGAAVTGSATQDGQDRWSDIDLFLGIADDADRNEVLADWSGWLHRDLGAIHHFDVRAGSTIYRVFLLPGALELDLAFAPAAEFSARGSQFRLIFGSPADPQNAPAPDVEDLIGRGWHHVLHARASIERGRPWQAEYWISALRDHTLAVACIRFGERTDFAKGVHHLPPEVTASLDDALVRSLDANELRRALQVAVDGFLRELRAVRPELAAQLEAALLEVANPE
jgi:hypothetical protein